MTELIGNILAFVFRGNSSLGTFFISMFPLIELKGGIPIGMSVDFWGDKALSGFPAFLFALLGSSTIVFLLPLVFVPILNFLKKTKLFKKLGEFIERKVNANSNKILSTKKSIILKMLAIFLFVAVPLPLTGVYMGCCVSVAIGLDYWQTVFSVFFGNIVAGLIIYFVCSIFPAFTTILFYIVLGIVAIVIVSGIFKRFISKKINIKE